MTQHYIAFLADHDLDHLAEEFINDMKHGGTKPRPDLIAPLTREFMVLAIDVYLIRPLHVVGLKGPLAGAVKLTAETIKKIGGAVITRVAGKLDLKQSQALAAYLEEMRIVEHDEDGNRLCWLAFPVDEGFAEEGDAAFGEAIAGESGRGHPRMKAHMNDFATKAFHFYMRKPLGMMKFGPILGKITAVAADGIEKAGRNAVRDIVPKLNKEEARKVAEYFSDLTIEK